MTISILKIITILTIINQFFIVQGFDSYSEQEEEELEEDFFPLINDVDVHSHQTFLCSTCGWPITPHKDSKILFLHISIIFEIML